MDESILLPSKWDGWEVSGLAGAGSFGTVWRICRRDNPSQEAAVKVIRIPSGEAEENALVYEYPDLQDRTAYCENLVQGVLGEIRTMELLKENAHVVRIYDSYVDHPEGSAVWTVYLMMELLTPLQEYMLEHPMDEHDILRIGIDLCEALEECENLHILHRDIKPENIMVGPDGAFKLGDFGVARQISNASLSMSLRGTFTYMAPEIYHGEDYGSLADQYSLGLVMYRFLNHNRDPFIDAGKQIIYYKDREEALRRRMGGQPLPAPSEASQAAADVLLKICSYRKEDRYPTAAACKAALQACCDQPAGSASDQTPVKQTAAKQTTIEQTPAKQAAAKHKNPEKKARRPVFRIIAALVLLAVLIPAGLYLYQNRTSFFSETRKVNEGLLSASALWGSHYQTEEPSASNRFADLKTDRGTLNLCTVPCFVSVLPDVSEKIILLGFKDQFDYPFYVYGTYRLDAHAVLHITKPDQAFPADAFASAYKAAAAADPASEFIRQLTDALTEVPQIAALEESLSYRAGFGYNGNHPYGELNLKSSRSGTTVSASYRNIYCSEEGSVRLSGMLSGPEPGDTFKGISLLAVPESGQAQAAVFFKDGSVTTDGRLSAVNLSEGRFDLFYDHVQNEYNGRSELFN